MKELNVTNGLYFNDFFEKTYLTKGIPFNEAFMTGTVCGELFGKEFCARRASALGVSVDEYMRKTEAFLKEGERFDEYGKINLWFGADAFCQINLLVILAFLETRKFVGKLVLHTIDDETFKEIERPREISLGGFYPLYQKVLIERVEADCFDAVMKRAIELYFDYLSPYGKLAKIVKENRGRGRKEVMIKLLLSSREYGLSDWQAGKLIDEYGGEQRSGGA